MIAVISCPECGNTNAHVIGVEIRGVYDGIAYWLCSCGTRFHRFPETDRVRVWLDSNVSGIRERAVDS